MFCNLLEGSRNNYNYEPTGIILDIDKAHSIISFMSVLRKPFPDHN